MQAGTKARTPEASGDTSITPNSSRMFVCAATRIAGVQHVGERMIRHFSKATVCITNDCKPREKRWVYSEYREGKPAYNAFFSRRFPLLGP